MLDIKVSKENICWLKNGIFALAVSGLYSIVLVLLRTPQISHFIEDKSIFKSSLVIHVNLSVLVWLLSMMSMIWGLNSYKTGLEKFYARVAFTGMLLMAVSPLDVDSIVVMNNYIPMLENVIFIIGLSLFGAITLCFAVQTALLSFYKCNNRGYAGRIIAITNFTSSVMFILVWVCFVLSYQGLRNIVELVPIDLEFYYEMMYWSGGHLLQFIYTQLLMISLLLLAETWKGGEIKFSAIYEVLLSLNFFLSLAAIIGHMRFDLSDGEFKEFYTLHMIYTAGIVPTIFIVLLYYEIFQSRIKNTNLFTSVSFIASSLLFLLGGMIGVVISGANVTIPAHYHGSIVGVSIALMGCSYLVCFRGVVHKDIFNKQGVINHFTNNINIGLEQKAKYSKAASWQIIVLTSGQLLHILGLALAGGYGVLRKTPGQEIEFTAKVYMAMVGGGGLLAIIGGLMFVYICVRKLYPLK